jgi:hypothetical protein
LPFGGGTFMQHGRVPWHAGGIGCGFMALR